MIREEVITIVEDDLENLEIKFLPKGLVKTTYKGKEITHIQQIRIDYRKVEIIRTELSDYD